MLIREERPSDIAAITNVHDQAFEGTEESRIVRGCGKQQACHEKREDQG
jgi:predicted N-acetyltransferase YhbS